MSGEYPRPQLDPNQTNPDNLQIHRFATITHRPRRMEYSDVFALYKSITCVEKQININRHFQ